MTEDINGFFIRRAEPRDETGIIKLIDSLSENPFIKNDLLIRESLVEWLTADSGHPSVVIADKKIVGFSYREIISKRYLWDVVLRVHPDYAGMGIGKLLMEETFSIGQREGLPVYNKLDSQNIVMVRMLARLDWRRVGQWLRLPLMEKSAGFGKSGPGSAREVLYPEIAYKMIKNSRSSEPFSAPAYVRNLVWYGIYSPDDAAKALSVAKAFASKNEFCFVAEKRTGSSSRLDVTVMAGDGREILPWLRQSFPESDIILYVPAEDRKTINLWFPLSDYPRYYPIMKHD